MKNFNQTTDNLHFQDLMLYKIHEILLIASPYDAFTLEQDGKLTEQILNEYIGMNLSSAPRVWNATSAKYANDILEKRNFDLIIIMMRIPDMNSIKLGRSIKKKYPKKPTVLLAFDESEIKRISLKQKQYFDEIFIWGGDSNVFPAIIKYIEDKKNIKRDIRKADIRTIILIEDTPKFYSKILPVIYKEIIFHTKKLIDESLNDTQKLLHMRGRPKILLATNYEDAIKLIKKYYLNVLGIITDVRFPIKNKKDDFAGVKLSKEIRKLDKSLPIIIQSNQKISSKILKDLSAYFLNKNSPTLFKELRKLLINNLGFGDFEFTQPNGEVISTAKNIEELAENIKKITDESLLYHASNNHLSNWLAARGEFNIASKFRSITINDFENIEQRRNYHIELLDQLIYNKVKPAIADYSSSSLKENHHFIRIGTGSLGGKARGLAFSHSIIKDYNFLNKFKNITIRVPKVVVISTSLFDEFMEQNNLWDFSLSKKSNKEIESKFLKSSIPISLEVSLKSILKKMKTPLAVRSSSLLEDSQYKPLAGMYSTLMISNSDKKIAKRYSQLIEAIKRIYASTFYHEAKSLMDSMSQRYEEEKMAIIIMELIGKNHDNIFYPTFSGVIQSYNYYPVSHMERKDGVAFLALGLGKTIADGEKSLRYCSKYPDILPQYYSTKSMINNSQNEFYALNLNNYSLESGESSNLEKCNLEDAEKHGELKHIAGVITQEDNILRETLQYKGPRILTFSSIIKYNSFPLNEILNDFINNGENFIGCPFEIEFAVNINKNKKSEFCLLQVKPMAIDSIGENIEIDKINESQVLCYSNQVLGDGISKNIKHIIYINPETFKRDSTKIIAQEIGKYNNILGIKNPYLLIGPGRWGTSDHWLGIPTNWEQISNAKSIIEIGIDELNPEPSFGSHFFQNLTSLRIGYFTITKKLYKKSINWKWIKKQKHIYKSNQVNVIELDDFLNIKIDGINGNGIILKPGKKDDKMNEDESSGI